MADEQIKQRFAAKAEIGVDEIEDDDIGIMTHRPNVLEGGDRKWKFGTLCLWIKKKLSDFFATKEELEPFATREELEPFATREELEPFATREELEPFATREELEPFATREELGDISELTTTDKTSVVRAVNEVNTNLSKLEIKKKTITASLSLNGNFNTKLSATQIAIMAVRTDVDSPVVISRDKFNNTIVHCYEDWRFTSYLTSGTVTCDVYYIEM